MTLQKTLVVMMAGIICALCAAVYFADAQENAPVAVQPVAKPTLDNLMTAYNGESNAHARYLAFAQKADEEGYGTVASLFRAAARAEQVHFEHHAVVIKEMGGTPRATIETPVVNTTRENLEAALKGEQYENTVMYPAFVKQAEVEKNAKAVDAFEDAMAAEGVHAALYDKALKEELDKGKTEKKEFYVCPKCGNVVDKLSFAVCPICANDALEFIKVS
ncbi:MAG: ferritin family protein [Candidatus Omnitrophica bacterium]|nr:ferritin family protein [Candidatus Omnitrophota bacterium]